MAFSMTTFSSLITKVNPKFERVKDSSLHDLMTLLESLKNKAPTADQKAKIQLLFAFVPSEKQKKYREALDHLSKELGPFVDAIPCQPEMTLHAFETNVGGYEGKNSSGVTKNIPLDPRSYHHLCRFSWKSSNGDLASLKKVGTRENVTYRTQPDAPPFNHVQSGTPMQFTQGATTNSGGEAGYCDDDHSTVVPHLICCEPRKEGSLIAEQWYEYTTDGTTWHHIPEAAYLLEKSVKKSGKDWLYVFKKQAWAPHNPSKFKLEIEYKIDAPPEFVPVPGKKIPKGLNQKADLKKFAHKIVSLK